MTATGDTATDVSSATVGGAPVGNHGLADQHFPGIRRQRQPDSRDVHRPGHCRRRRLRDPNLSDYTNQFTASIAWGDGNTSTGTITFNSTTGVFSVAGSHTYTATGDYSVTTTVTPQSVSASIIDSSYAGVNNDYLNPAPDPNTNDAFPNDLTKARRRRSSSSSSRPRGSKRREMQR